jgi:hypothetical protein
MIGAFMIVRILITSLLFISGCSTQPILHGVGVYEGPHHFGGRPVDDPSPSTINIHVHSKSHPVILVLFNYEAVMWNITTDKNVVIKEIILSSAQGAKVKGIDETTVRVTRKDFGYAYSDKPMESITPLLKKYTGLDLATFQGSYRGAEFSVGP